MDFIQYIIHFLVGKDASLELINSIGYTADESKFSHYKFIIYPSSFFNENVYGTDRSLPRMPLEKWEEIPILYGKSLLEKRGEAYILYADIVASTYFLITRYEEIVRRNVRDRYGRFPGKESLPYKASFIDYPLIDKYGCLLRKLLIKCGLNVPNPPEELNKIYLTHDVDSLTKYRHLRGFLGSFKYFQKDNEIIKNSFKANIGGLEGDPYYTFPYLFDCAKKAGELISNEIESIIFIKTRGKRQEDRPNSNIKSRDFSRFLKLTKDNNVKIGLHASYEAGINPALIISEKNKLEQITGSVLYNRHHFLASLQPEDMEALIEAGITDDFTMGYADIAGFRLGTSKAVRWINPITKQLTSLTLHPITVMDITLSDGRYMGLNEQEAFEYVVKLIEETKNYNGDLCLLWHNTSIGNVNSYHRRLYNKIIDYLCGYKK